MPYEELITVQDIADDQTEVASKTTDLMTTYHIQADEIGDYEITPFGTNKFLITIIYLFKISEKFWDQLGLSGAMTSISANVRSKVASIGSTVLSVATELAITRIKEPAIGIANTLARTIVESRTLDALLVGLAAEMASYETLGLAPRRTPIAFAISAISRFIETQRSADNALVGFSLDFQAWYNGVPIEV